MQKIPITRTGYRNLLKELVYLWRVRRPQVLEELHDARLFGIRSDNQQYLLAREMLAVLQKKIQDLEQKLADCEVVVGRKFYCKQVVFGTITVIQNLDTGERHQYQIVGPYESDVTHGKLSIHSPVGRGLLDHHEGDEVSILTPSGRRIYRIISIQA
jgi:transcription elongation factor GreA